MTKTGGSAEGEAQMKLWNKEGIVRALICVMAAGLCGLPAAAQSRRSGAWGIQRKSDRTMKTVSKIIYRETRDEYTVTVGTATYQVKARDVVRLLIPAPANWDRLKSEVKRTEPPSATVSAMEGIAQQYRKRVWDTKAWELLMPVYAAQKKYSKMKRGCAQVKKLYGRVPPELMTYWWEALIQTNDERIKNELDDAIERGSRPTAAVAYVKRGDLLKKKGQTKQALIQGYLRAVLMFGDVKSVQPEALYKTYLALKDRGDGRSERFKRKLLDEYPRSSYSKGL